MMNELKVVFEVKMSLMGGIVDDDDDDDGQVVS